MGRTHRVDRTTRVAAAAHGLSLVAGLAVLLMVNRHQWFAGDDWDFLARRGLRGAEAGLFEPHNEHWSTGPILVFRALYSLFGLRSYLPYVAVLVAIHLTLAHLLWRIMRRVGVDPAVASALTAVFAVLGAGTENLVWAFQIGFVGSVLLGTAAIMLVDHDGPFDHRDRRAWLVSVLSLAFSGISVTMVVVTGLTALLRRGARQAALTVAVPAGVYLLWLVLAGGDALGAGSTDTASLLGFSDFVWTGLSTAFDRAVGLDGGGPVMVLALGVWLLRRSDLASTDAASAFAGALGAVSLFTIIALGRSGLGIEQAANPRYVYICIALVLPAVGLALTDLASGVTGRTVAVLGVVALALVHNLALLRHDARNDAERERILERRVLAAAELVSSGPASDEGLLDLTSLPDLSVRSLRRMVDEGKLPRARDLTAADRLEAATFLRVDIGPGALAPSEPPGARIGSVRQAAVEPGTGSCVRVTPEEGGAPEVLLTSIDGGAGGPVSVSLSTPAGGALDLFLRTTTPEVLTGPPRRVDLEPGRAVRFDDRAPGAVLILHPPSSSVTDLCGVAPEVP